MPDYLMQLSRRIKQQVYEHLWTSMRPVNLTQLQGTGLALRRYPHTLSYKTASTAHMYLFSLLTS